VKKILRESTHSTLHFHRGMRMVKNSRYSAFRVWSLSVSLSTIEQLSTFVKRTISNSILSEEKADNFW
jgi:hypothetical protein